MAMEQCTRPIEKTVHEKSHEQHLSSGQTQVHKESKDASQPHGQNQLSHDMNKTHAESKTPSHGIHAQQHTAQGMAMTCHGKKEKKMKEKKKDKDKDKKEKKEKKTEKKKPEKEKSKHKKGKDRCSDTD